MSVRCESARRRSDSRWSSRPSRSVRPGNLVWQLPFLSTSSDRRNPDAAGVADSLRGKR